MPLHRHAPLSCMVLVLHTLCPLPAWPGPPISSPRPPVQQESSSEGTARCHSRSRGTSLWSSGRCILNRTAAWWSPTASLLVQQAWLHHWPALAWTHAKKLTVLFSSLSLAASSSPMHSRLSELRETFSPISSCTLYSLRGWGGGGVQEVQWNLHFCTYLKFNCTLLMSLFWHLKNCELLTPTTSRDFLPKKLNGARRSAPFMKTNTFLGK